ncbi:MAG: glycosyltransferase family 39 protein [candidate division WOR-3 bacterium]
MAKFPTSFRRNLVIIVIALGIIFRIGQFLYNRSLTEGEAALALNILQRSYQDLLKPLAYHQAAPYGFLLIQKFFSNLVGNNDYALRIFPLICGISSIFLFYAISQRILTEGSALWGIFLFSFCDHLIYFSSEVKQYSSDVTIGLILIFIALSLQNHPKVKQILLLGLAGAISIWFSHPSLFVFLGCIIALGIQIIKSKRKDYFFLILSAVFIWLISFLFNYTLNLKYVSQNQTLLQTWEKSFMPLPPKSIADLKWFCYVFLRLFKNPLGFSIYEITFIAFIFLVGLFIYWQRDRNKLLMLIIPIILALLASGLKKYPFEGRLLLFIIPLMFWVIAEGLDYIKKIVSSSSHSLSLMLIAVILLPTGIAGFYHLFSPRAPEELRPVISYVRTHKQEGDIIYLYYASYNSFLYYSRQFGFDENDYIVGIESRTDCTQYYTDLRRLKGNPRIWFLFSHVSNIYGVDEEKLFITILNTLGKKLDAFKAPGAACYLYDLSK